MEDDNPAGGSTAQIEPAAPKDLNTDPNAKNVIELINKEAVQKLQQLLDDAARNGHLCVWAPPTLHDVVSVTLNGIALQINVGERHPNRDFSGYQPLPDDEMAKLLELLNSAAYHRLLMVFDPPSLDVVDGSVYQNGNSVQINVAAEEVGS